MDEFITIAQLAQGLNVSEKVIRHAFKKLLKQNKLIEGEDYIREGYRDELHFVYKIHPGRFAVHSQLLPAFPSVDNLATKFATTGTQADSKSATQGTEFDSNLASKPDDRGSQPGTHVGSHDNNNAAREEFDAPARTESSKDNEFLEKLFATKDEQVSDLKMHIADLRSQLAKKDEQLAQAQSMLTTMQEGQDSAHGLIRMLGERIVDFSRRALPSGSNGATQANTFATRFATTSDDLATHDEELGNNSANSVTTPHDERAAYPQ